MSGLKINFKLKELDEIMPWGQEPHLSLHWFGLTDGLLWINAGTQTIYEYSDEAADYFGNYIRYNDYQISRFLEDFFGIFRYVGESIPEKLYNSIDELAQKTDKWNARYDEEDEEDEVYDRWFYEEYCVFCEWWWNRMFDSGHLVGGPVIGCFRCGEKIKILWESTFQTDNKKSIWTAPKGSFEMPYKEFVSSVTDFFHSFFEAMDRQVKNAVNRDWGNVELDKQRLLEENEERKSAFLKMIAQLESPNGDTDWDKIMMLYEKM